MSVPKRFEVNLSSYGYYMEVDTKKSECNRVKTPHWHLCGKFGREGSIDIYGNWIEIPNVDHHIKKEAEGLTSRYVSIIRKVYTHNRHYGSDY